MRKKKGKTKSPSNALVPVNKGGRPLAVVDEEKLIELASVNATIQEVCSELNVSHDTLYTRFSEPLKKGRDKGNISIKRKLFEKAMGGDTSALIWISKNQCGYRDKPPEEATMIQFNVYVNEVPK
jgi:hypothetical protein